MGPLQNAFVAGGGFATSDELTVAGADSRTIRRLLAEGRIVRHRRGYYGLPSSLPSGGHALRLGGRLAGLSAADSFGIWAGWEHPLTLAVRGNAALVGGRRPATQAPGRRHDPAVGEFVVHWNDDRRDRRWCWRVSADRCVLQTLRWNDSETAAAVVETALSAGLIDLPELLRRTEGSPTLQALVRTCRSGAGSGVESIGRRRFERCGLEFDLQYPVPGVGRVDLKVVGAPLLIEFDGYRFHSSPARFADDRRRSAEAQARGFTTLRFTAVQVREDWDWVESTVFATLSRIHR